MPDVDEALAQIAEIRHQMARSLVFQGYGPMALASTGAIALASAALQALFLPNPATVPVVYVGYWMTIAALASAVMILEMVTRSARAHSDLAEEMIWTAVEQFLPAVAAGTLLTLVILRFSPDTVWMLPGLWQIVFALGVFASCRFLPRPVFMVGVWYLSTGCICLSLGQGEAALAPWTMALPFGTGQFLTAGILWWTLEPIEDFDAAA